MPKAHSCVTYEVTIEESAAEGCVAEHGWWMPGGWEYPLEDGEGYHEGTLNDARVGMFDLSVTDGIKHALDLGATYEVTVNGDSLTACSVDPPLDRANIEDGEERHYTLHISGCSAGTIARCAKLLSGG
jgi:hypothetical protein